MTHHFDLVIIGSGPGGYVAAIEAARLGFSVAIVEKEKLGGVCLHKGCIPSKVLLKSAELFHALQKSEAFGLQVGSVQVNMALLQKRKQSMIDELHQGVKQLLDKHGVKVYYGHGRLMGPSIFSPLPGTVAVESPEQNEAELLSGRYVLLATGSRPREIEGLPFDGEKILSSDQAFHLSEFPKSILIIGGGAIGVEWASLLSDFGVEVVLVEEKARILPMEDEEISQEMTRQLNRRKVKVITQAVVLPEQWRKDEHQVKAVIQHRGETLTLKAEKVLVCVGRTPNTEDIGLSNTSIQVTERGIRVNAHMQTAEKHIYAIGDVIGGYQLAHVASREGKLAVHHMAGLKEEALDVAWIPRCTYSRPEVASIGLSEQEAKEQGYSVKIGKIPFRSIGKAAIHQETAGFIKIVSDRESEDLLGVHMIGHHVTELIAEAGLAKILDATVWEISQVVHPHLTLSEIFGEVSWVMEQPIKGGVS